MTPAKLRLAQAALMDPRTEVNALCKETDITRQPLYRHVSSPTGQLRSDGQAALKRAGNIYRLAASGNLIRVCEMVLLRKQTREPCLGQQGFCFFGTSMGRTPLGVAAVAW